MTGTLRRRLHTGPPIVLDGPVGTRLVARGAPLDSPLWDLEAVRQTPEQVQAVHAEYVDAGAEVLTAATFRASPAAAIAAGLTEKGRAALVQQAVALARAAGAAATRDVWVAASIAPLADCYRPDLVPPDDVLARDHAKTTSAAAAAQPDLLLVETMNTVREAVQAVAAGVRTGLPVWCAFVITRGARLLSGEALAEAVQAVREAGAEAVLVNCAGLHAVHEAVPHLQQAGLPWGAYPNGHEGDAEAGWGAATPIADFEGAARRWADQGARVLGACCASGPAHVRRLGALRPQA